MAIRASYDAVVVGAGPNGLAAAITLARAGRSVIVFEARGTVGGGCRSAELTLPGFVHDVCSAIHPMALASPFFRALPLEQYGLEWIQPPAALAHPLDDGSAAVLERSIEATGATLGEDAGRYYRLMAPIVANWDKIAEGVLGPLRIPHHPFALARFGLSAIRSSRGLAESRFKAAPARALFGGIAGHAMLELERPPGAAFGLVLAALGHVVGWPIPRGGSQKIADAMAAYLRSLGGEIVTGVEIESLETLPSASAILCDVTPRQLLRMAGRRLSPFYQRQLRHYRYGPGVCKVDFALDWPIPWEAEVCSRAGTVHLGGTLGEIAESERAVWKGEHAERPLVLLAQQSLFDSSRAPAGKHTAWAYCHVPSGSTRDVSDKIEEQIERFAPGFRARILAKSVVTAEKMERYNANYIGGDINGGVQDFWQLFTRPTIRLVPYATSAKGLYLCSSSTPPGGAVHGLCGYFAAQAAMRRGF